MPAKKTPRTAAVIQKELDAFKQRVVDTTMDWNGGCVEGKVDFLYDLDLTPPKKLASFNVKLSLPIVPGDDPEVEANVVLNDLLRNTEVDLEATYTEFYRWEE